MSIPSPAHNFLIGDNTEELLNSSKSIVNPVISGVTVKTTPETDKKLLIQY